MVDTIHASQSGFEASAFETKQAFYESKDGTKIPLFLTYKKGLALDGTNPTVLYGYGGFGVSMTPFYNVANAFWADQGGVFAVACIRGGNEYGRQWHEAGRLERKQNCFDDFIAGAQWLIDEGYTSRERLAIRGGSNGGLLVASLYQPAPRPLRRCRLQRARHRHAPLPPVHLRQKLGIRLR